MMGRKLAFLLVLGFLCFAGIYILLCLTRLVSSHFSHPPPASGCVAQEEEEEALPTADEDLGASREGSRTDAEAVER